ncbi:MAG TPA: hypothetical protein VGM44_20650, partial [Polyangiaceae bacterium]
LRFHPTGPTAEVGVTLALAALDAQPHSIRVSWVRDPGPETTLSLSGAGFERSARIESGASDCKLVELAPVTLTTEPQEVRFQASRPGILDYVEVLP